MQAMSNVDMHGHRRRVSRFGTRKLHVDFTKAGAFDGVDSYDVSRETSRIRLECGDRKLTIWELRDRVEKTILRGGLIDRSIHSAGNLNLASPEETERKWMFYQSGRYANV